MDHLDRTPDHPTRMRTAINGACSCFLRRMLFRCCVNFDNTRGALHHPTSNKQPRGLAMSSVYLVNDIVP